MANHEHASIANKNTIPRRRLYSAIAGGMMLFASCSNSNSHAFKDGCETFRVYAQNRWQPYGTAVREEPDVLSKKLDPGFAPNEVIAVNGYVRTGRAIYPDNIPPWNSDIYFRLANRAGWVSFPGVRGEPSTPDPTGLSSDGGVPAPTSAECLVDYKP